MNVIEVNKLIAKEKESNEKFEAGDISDTHHTFNELYYVRMILSALVFNTYRQYAWKSKLHEDGTMFDDMFIVGIETLEGGFSFHYDMADWDKFDVEELDRGRPWDGHVTKDIPRLLSLLTMS